MGITRARDVIYFSESVDYSRSTYAEHARAARVHVLTVEQMRAQEMQRLPLRRIVCRNRILREM